MVLASTIVKPFAATPPIVTALAPARFTPVMVTCVPPRVVPPVGLIDVTDVPLGANTLIAVDAPFPLATTDVTGVVVLYFTPAVVAVTLTETTQDERGLIATPETRNRLLPALADTTPPHEFMTRGGVATINPTGNELPKATSLATREPLLLILKDKVVVSPTPIVGAPKLMERAGACAIAKLVDPTIPSRPANESTAARTNVPARGRAFRIGREPRPSALTKSSNFTFPGLSSTPLFRRACPGKEMRSPISNSDKGCAGTLPPRRMIE